MSKHITEDKPVKLLLQRVLPCAVIFSGLACAQLQPPVVTKLFDLPSIPVNTSIGLSFTVSNPNGALNLTNVSFLDTLPAGVEITNPSSITGSCTSGSSGVVTPIFATNQIQFSQGFLAAGGSCQFTVSITVTAVGTFLNSVTVQDEIAGTGNTSTDSITGAAPPAIAKTFTPATILVGQTSVLRFVLSNPNAVNLTGLAFSDPLPAGLIFTGGVVTNCTGTINAPAGATTITVSGGVLAGGASCEILVNVLATGTVLGSLTNTTSVVTSVEGGAGNSATAALKVGSGDAFQVRYVANLNITDSLLNFTNTGVNGAMPFGPGIGPQAGNICVNVYAFSPDEQMVGCCSCHVTPNGLASMSVYNDIRAITLTGLTPNSMMIKLVSTATGLNGAGPAFTGGASSCTQSAAGIAVTHPVAQGLAAWATTGHVPGAFPVPGAPAPFAITETAFTPATLSMAEILSLNNRCTAIIGNGSTFGTCRSCTLGGRGSDKF